VAKKKATKSLAVPISDPSANPENPDQDPKVPTTTKEGREKKVKPLPKTDRRRPARTRQKAPD
jgi:hypothetical protein